MYIILPTSQGHLDQERENLQSIKSFQSDKNEDLYPEKIPLKTDKYYTVIIPAPEYNKEK